MPDTSDPLAVAVHERNSAGRSATERTQLDDVWEQISHYMMPTEGHFQERVHSESVHYILKNRTVLDSTGARSLELSASFLHTLLNNPATRWIDMSVVGKTTEELSTDAQIWLEHELSNKMLHAVAGPQSSLYGDLHTLYMSLLAFGTACLFIEGQNGHIQTRHISMADIVIDENVYGAVDTVFRSVRMTARQAQQRWPKKSMEDLGPALKAEKGSHHQEHRRVPFLHAVFPTDDQAMMEHIPASVREKLKFFPFASVWTNDEDKMTVSIKGYGEFPYCVPRWYKVKDNVYGRSPGMTTLPDVRMANRMKETILRGGEKLVDPPLLIPEGSILSPVRLMPGGITFTNGNQGPQPLIPPGASRIEFGQALLEQTQQSIREGFFTTLLLTPDSPVRTATEVLQLADERNKAIAPMLIRLYQELFHTLVARVYGVLNRAGVFKSAPSDLQGQSISLQYVSPMVASQRQTEALGTARMLEGIIPMAQADPGVVDYIHPERYVKAIHSGSGAPANVLRTKSEIKAIQEQRAAQSQAAQAQELIPAIEAQAKTRTADAALLKAQKG